MVDQKPSVGRIVHYHSYGTPGGEFLPQPRAAVIAEVLDDDNGFCSIVVLNPKGVYFNDAHYSEEPKPGCWNWPPRV